MARWLGIDHGTRRLGVAVADTETGIASPVEQLLAGDQRLTERIRRVAREYAADGIVVGWPLNADRTEGPQAVLARRFAAALARKTGIDVRLWDEHLTSFEADEKLRGQLTRKKRRRRHDAVAAAAILADFLAHDGPDAAPRPADVEGPAP